MLPAQPDSAIERAPRRFGWIIPVLLLAGVIGLGLVAAPANSDTAGYLAALDAEGFTYASPGYAVNTGLAICHALRAGDTPPAIARAVVNGADGTVGAREANRLIIIAAAQLCLDQLAGIVEYRTAGQRDGSLV